MLNLIIIIYIENQYLYNYEKNYFYYICLKIIIILGYEALAM